MKGADGDAEYDAEKHLTPDDRAVLRFYATCSDQLVNLFPFAEEQTLVPRLEGWLAACELLNVPRVERQRLIEMARVLHSGTQGQLSSDEKLDAHLAEPYELAPPEEP